MLELTIIFMFVAYYILWVIQGALRPWQDITLQRIQAQLDNTADEEWVNRMKDIIDSKLILIEKQIKAGEISEQEYKETKEAYEHDYKDIRTKEGAKSSVTYVKQSTKSNLRKARLAILATQLTYRLLAGIPILVLFLTGGGQTISLLLSFIFMLTYSIISDIVITRDESKIEPNTLSEDEEYLINDYNFSKIVTIFATAVVTQIPFFVILIVS